MRAQTIVASFIAAVTIATPLDSASGQAPRESRIPVGKTSLYSREIGRGQPIMVLHGGPDFDQAYLVPDLDRLANAFRLIYYDQRGRGNPPLACYPAM